MPVWIGKYANIIAGIVIAAVLVYAGVAIYDKGYNTADAEWQVKWAKRDADDAAATALKQKEEREKEQARQHAAEEIKKNAQQQIDQAAADAAAAHATADSLRDAADTLAAELERSESSRDSCVAGSSKAATASARVLSDVLKRADERAGVLAAIADQARIRGLACEAAYDALRREEEKE